MWPNQLQEMLKTSGVGLGESDSLCSELLLGSIFHLQILLFCYHWIKQITASTMTEYLRQPFSCYHFPLKKKTTQSLYFSITRNRMTEWHQCSQPSLKVDLKLQYLYHQIQLTQDWFSLKFAIARVEIPKVFLRKKWKPKTLIVLHLLAMSCNVSISSLLEVFLGDKIWIIYVV